MKKFSDMVRECRKCKVTKPVSEFYTNYKTNKPIARCKECSRKVGIEYGRRPRYDKCQNCGCVKIYNVTELCPLCSISNREQYIKDGRKHRKELNDFVDRVIDRCEFVSLNELFVDIITFYNIYGSSHDTVGLSPGDQLEYMWKYIKTYSLKDR